MPKTIGIYGVGPEIGKGSFATVYKCVNTRTHQPVAIKSVVRSKLKSKKLLENLEIEIMILKSMKHPHVVGLLDYHQTSTHFHLVMNFCSMGDLSYFIRRRDQLVKSHPVVSSMLQRYPLPEGSHGLNETLVIHLLKQLSLALEFLRSKSLVHRDIKPQNLLLCPPMHSKKEFDEQHYTGLWELPILKLADFGFARFLPSTSMAETLCGSPLYMAPEILRYEKYNAKADLWSVGTVLYEMTVGKPPFRAANHIELLRNIEKAHDKVKFPTLAQVPEALKSLISSLLKYMPAERVSFNEFFSNPLITTELESNNKPLDTSDVDENLFISEYISPIKAADRAKYILPLTTAGEEHERSESPHDSLVVRKQATPIPGSSAPRDEQIKLIITRNSPDPAHMTQSIQPRYVETGHNNVREDIVLERDYVVVEKRSVEVNAIADELARVNLGAFGRRRSSANSERDVVLHRRNSQRSGSFLDGQQAPSLERRISISISPTNALGKAISLASNRIFGTNVPRDLIPEEGSSDLAKAGGALGMSPNFAQNLLLNKAVIPSSSIASGGKDDGGLDGDEKVLSTLESIATKAHAVNLFADVKFSQLIPSPPSSGGDDNDFVQQADFLPPKMIKSISEEGVALYVKTLSLLAKGMAIASEWWQMHYNRDEATNEQQLVRSIDVLMTVKINELVQWTREKFNECLEKAEFIKLRLQEATLIIERDAQAALAASSSSLHSTPRASSAILRDGTSELAPVVAEKLIFDRALEISRNAAVNELVKEDLRGCELAYSTAIWMLEALLDEDHKEEARLDTEDRAMVEKFIMSIGNRLSVLKRKLDMM